MDEPVAEGGGDPTGGVKAQIEADFDDFAQMQKQFNAATLGVQGSGWGVLAWEPVAQKLLVQQVYDHQGEHAQGTIPILVCDIWEHAFYLQYENRKAEWVSAFWKLVDWNDVSRRLQDARGAKSSD